MKLKKASLVSILLTLILALSAANVGCGAFDAGKNVVADDFNVRGVSAMSDSSILAASTISGPNSVDLGQTINLTSTITTGTPPYTYKWFYINPIYSYFTVGGNSANLSIDTTGGGLEAGNWDFILQVTDSTGASVNSTEVTVMVFADPSVQIIPASLSMNVGQSKIFTAIASDGAGSYTSYKWYVNDVAQTGSGSTFDFSGEKIGIYDIYAVVKDSLGVTSFQSNSVTVNVTSILVSPTIAVSSDKLIQNQYHTCTLTSNVTTGASPYKYQWFSEAPNTAAYSLIRGAASPSYNFTASISVAAGNWKFILQVNDSLGKIVNSTAATVTVTSLPPGSVTFVFIHNRIISAVYSPTIEFSNVTIGAGESSNAPISLSASSIPITVNIPSFTVSGNTISNYSKTVTINPLGNNTYAVYNFGDSNISVGVFIQTIGTIAGVTSVTGDGRATPKTLVWNSADKLVMPIQANAGSTGYITLTLSNITYSLQISLYAEYVNQNGENGNCTILPLTNVATITALPSYVNGTFAVTQSWKTENVSQLIILAIAVAVIAVAVSAVLALRRQAKKAASTPPTL